MQGNNGAPSVNSSANSLEKGHKIASYATHHLGMKELLRRRGRPRPEGMTLSLLVCNSPDTYWGNWCIMWDAPYRRRLSTNPDDYGWESNADNLRRNPKDNEIYIRDGLISFEDEVRTYHGPLEVISLDEWASQGGIKRQELVAKYWKKIGMKRKRY